MVFLACIPHSVNFIKDYLEINNRASVRNVFYNMYMVQELILLTLFFNNLIVSKKNKYLFKVSVYGCVLLGIVSIIYNGIHTSFLFTWLSFNNIAYTMWVLLLLYELYDRDDDNFVPGKPLLFYLFGLFFYTSCTIPAFGLWDYMESNKDSYLKHLNIIHHTFNVIMYVFFSAGFILEYRLSNQKINRTYGK